jgi:hypothetical protein
LGWQQTLAQSETNAPDCTMSIRKTRNVSFTPKLEAFIEERVAADRYRSASDTSAEVARITGRHCPRAWCSASGRQ